MKIPTTKNNLSNVFLVILGISIFLGVMLFPVGAEGIEMAKKTSSTHKTAVFAGGCFWCMEKDFEKLDGVLNVTSGYTGDSKATATYPQVSSGGTNHREVIQVTYDSKKVSYEKLLEHFWMNIDPFNDNGQFCDNGFQYTAAIYYSTAAEKKLAEESKESAEMHLGAMTVTAIEKLGTFYVAEEYHQDYYKKHPIKYNTYRFLCGRDRRLKQVWHNKTLDLFDDDEGFSETEFVKPSDAELREMLTDIQYKVTQQDGTERSFNNEYWDNTEPGIYVDIVSGEPLFSSIDKYKSGTGWPSFTKPLVESNIVTKTDYKWILPRTEVRSKHADSHVGHVFKDGPEPTGLRYCMNSAALRFVHKDDLKKEGYEEFLYLFE